MLGFGNRAILHAVRRRRGYVLFSVFLIAIILSMTARAVLYRRAGLQQVVATEQTRALLAARSGLAYAKGRLAEDANWRGDGNRTTVTNQGVTITEQSGNVIGTFHHSDSGMSQFRLRFNYQDGSGGPDELDDPSSENLIDHQWVSVNNLTKSQATVVPLADTDTWSVSDPSLGTELPGNAASIAVEGRSGRVGGRLTSRVVEHVLKAKLSQPATDAAVMGGTSINLTVAERVHMWAQGVPRLRTKGGVTVVDENGSPGELFFDSRGEIGRDSSAGVDANLTGKHSQYDEWPGDGRDFYNLPWSQAPKADSSPATTNAVHIPAGVYAFWDDETLHYYDMDYEDYETYMLNPANVNDPGVVITTTDLSDIRDPLNVANNPTGLNLNIRKGRIGVSKDLYVKPTAAGTQDFAIVPRGLAHRSPEDTSPLPAVSDRLGVSHIKLGMANATLSGERHTILLGELEADDGSATLTGGGEFRCITPEIDIGANSERELNLYYKGDIDISSYNGTDYGRIQMSGVVYTWGNFTSSSSSDSLATSSWGGFILKGALVAYGADPISEDPGSGTGGEVNISGRSVTLRWSPHHLPRLSGLSSGAASSVDVTFERTLYNEL